MAKNKGLTPKRKKINRNPRVKHREKYRRAQIKRKGQVSILQDIRSALLLPSVQLYLLKLWLCAILLTWSLISYKANTI